MSFFSGNPFAWQNPLLTSQRVGNTNIKVPGASVYATAAQSLDNGVQAAITFAFEYFDNGDIFTLTDPTKITIKVPGVYHIIIGCNFDSSSATGFRELAIDVNGTGGILYDDRPGSTAFGVTCEVTAFRKLAARDYIRALATQNSGGSLNLLGNGYSRMALIWVSA